VGFKVVQQLGEVGGFNYIRSLESSSTKREGNRKFQSGGETMF
jgi:hypothetical protein